jgi:hypothetical protein
VISTGKSGESRPDHYHLPMFCNLGGKGKVAAWLVVEMAVTGLEVVSVPRED